MSYHQGHVKLSGFEGGRGREGIKAYICHLDDQGAKLNFSHIHIPNLKVLMNITVGSIMFAVHLIYSPGQI